MSEQYSTIGSRVVNCSKIMIELFKILQIIFAVLLVVLVLLQQRGSGLGMAFGGEGNVYRSRRGVEKFIFYATIVVAVFFCAIALFSVFFA
jgi:preprotein translocase subunit SecG